MSNRGEIRNVTKLKTAEVLANFPKTTKTEMYQLIIILPPLPCLLLFLRCCNLNLHSSFSVVCHLTFSGLLGVATQTSVNTFPVTAMDKPKKVKPGC